MNKNLYVIKNNGNKELINTNKINKILCYASYNLNNISILKIKKKSYVQFYDGIKTSIIHNILIKSAINLVSEKFPDYQFVAARLLIFDLRKRAYGKFSPPSLYNHVSYLVSINKYDSILLKKYSKEEFDLLDKYIDHNRDMLLSYNGVKELEANYLVQNKITGKIYESLQFIYILISAYFFINYKRNIRIKYVKKFYDAISLFKIFLSTHIMSKVRTLTKQFSSCVLIECGDSLDSINATTNSIIKYVSRKVNVGINVGRLRTLGSPIRLGEIFHKGCILFHRLFQSAIECFSNKNIFSKIATLFYPIWYLEIEDLLILKNNLNNINYCIQINSFIYKRLLNRDKITLFNPYDVSDLYNYFFIDQKKFKELYLYYENKDNIRKKIIYAVDLFNLLLKNNNNICIQNIDHCNLHSPFNVNKCSVKQSNLYLDVVLPTKPLVSPNSNKGEISLCTLSAFNLGKINNLHEIKDLSNLLVRGLDGIIDYQDYPIYAAKYSTLNRRSLGIGVTNFAYYLAKNGVRYSDGSANILTHKTFEWIQFYLLNASNILSKEKGKCKFFNDTNYYLGLLPIDTYKKDVDLVCNESLHCDWDKLRKKINKYGLRNSTLSAIFSSKMLSQLIDSTGCIKPPEKLINTKIIKGNIYKKIVPEIIKLKNKYELLCNLPNNIGYLHLISIIQKFIDHSVNFKIDYSFLNFKNNIKLIKVLLNDLLISHNLGIKTIYYKNINNIKKYCDKNIFISPFCDLCKT